MPTPQHISQREIYRGKLNDTAYGTSRSTGTTANYKQLVAKGKNLSNPQPNVQDNKDYATGYPRATEQWLSGHDLGFSHDFDLCAEELGRDLYDVFGKDTITQPDATNNASVYQHLYSTMDLTVTRQPPSRTWVEKVGSAIDRALPGVCCAQLALSGEGSQRLVGSGQWQGSGKVVNPSGLTGTKISGLHYFYESQCGVTFDDGTTITNLATASNRLNSWRFEIINQLLTDDGFRPGAAAFQTSGNPDTGEVRTEMLLGDQSFNIVTNVRLLSNDPFIAYLLAQTNLIFLNTITGPAITGAGTDGSLNYKLIIKAYKAPFKAVQLGERKGLVTLELTINPLFDLTTSKDLEVTLINKEASYVA